MKEMVLQCRLEFAKVEQYDACLASENSVHQRYSAKMYKKHYQMNEGQDTVDYRGGGGKSWVIQVLGNVGSRHLKVSPWNQPTPGLVWSQV